MTSEEMKDTQHGIELLLCDQIKKPMKNYQLIAHYIEVLKHIDGVRRDTWHEEKFGAYNDMVSEVFKTNFTVDDIPF